MSIFGFYKRLISQVYVFSLLLIDSFLQPEFLCLEVLYVSTSKVFSLYCAFLPSLVALLNSAEGEIVYVFSLKFFRTVSNSVKLQGSLVGEVEGQNLGFPARPPHLKEGGENC